MAFQHIPIATGSPHGGKLKNALDSFEAALAALKDEVAAMPFMVDGSNFTHLETQFGIPTGKGETAKAELESMLGKLTTDAEVTNVASSIQQVFNFFA